MRTTTKGEDVFELVDNFFKENGLQWTKLVGCTSNGAPAMFGRKSGFQARVKAVSPSVTSVHCFIHRFSLATRLLPSDIKTYSNLVVKMVNYIKTSAINSRLFKGICENTGVAVTMLHRKFRLIVDLRAVLVSPNVDYSKTKFIESESK